MSIRLIGPAILSLLAACSSLEQAGPVMDAPAGIVRVAAAAAAPDEDVETGPASWYGPRHHGHRTASGERFDMHALSAAHPSLPFGTEIVVTNLGNGRSVKVRVNDRGPHRAGFVVDLSSKAAEEIGLRRSGVANVSIRPA
jgi:rare lipoprotein A